MRDRGTRARREIYLENSKKIAFTRRFFSLSRTLFCFEVEIIRPDHVLCSPAVPDKLLEEAALLKQKMNRSGAKKWRKIRKNQIIENFENRDGADIAVGPKTV